MKPLITLLFLLPLSAFSQDYCQGILDKAEKAYKKNELEAALTILQDAETCDYKNQLQTERQKLQIDIFKAIEKQRREALTAKNQAERLSDYFFRSSKEPVAWAYGSNGKFGVVNREGELQGEGFVWEKPESFQKGYAIAQRGGDYWYVNPKGEAASEGYDWIHPTILPFMMGITKTSGRRKKVSLDTLNGENLGDIQLIIQEKYKHLNSSLFSFQQMDKRGVINPEGKVVIEPKFEKVFSFSNGLAWVYEGGKYGLINSEGKVVIEPKFDKVSSFFDGLTKVKQGGKLGFINSEGKVVIQPRFESVSSFSEGMASVEQGGKVGFINPEGKVVFQPRFEYAESFSEGLARIMQGGKWGFINLEGKVVIEPIFEYLSLSPRGWLGANKVKNGALSIPKVR